MKQKLKAWALGLRATMPFISALFPFGILYATLAISAGLPWWIVILFSIVVFGGSSQLVFIDLFQISGSAFQAVLGSNIVNARHLIYSASVSDRFGEYPRHWKILLSYLLTDHLYAVAESKQKSLEQLPSELHPWFYFGSGFCSWFFWVFTTVLGILFGHIIPSSWNLSFSIPLLFMPLIFSVSKNNFAYVTSISAMVFVYILRPLPFGLGVFFSILLASFVGFWIQRHTEAKPVERE